MIDYETCSSNSILMEAHVTAGEMWSNVPSNVFSESNAAVSSDSTAGISAVGTEQLLVEISVDSKIKVMSIATVSSRGIQSVGPMPVQEHLPTLKFRFFKVCTRNPLKLSGVHPQFLGLF